MLLQQEIPHVKLPGGFLEEYPKKIRISSFHFLRMCGGFQ